MKEESITKRNKRRKRLPSATLDDLQQEINSCRDDYPSGIYNPVLNAIEVGSTLYYLQNDAANKEKIREWMEQGIIQEGHTNKYKDHYYYIPAQKV